MNHTTIDEPVNSPTLYSGIAPVESALGVVVSYPPLLRCLPAVAMFGAGITPRPFFARVDGLVIAPLEFYA